jgi:flagellar export protein FliJ
MKPGVFRFEALLDVYQIQEDSLRGEISSLEGERKGVLNRIEDLLRECLAARKVLTRGGRVNEVEPVVRYVEGLQHWIEQSRSREQDLQKQISERMAALQSIRTERLRFGKLKERHRKQIYQHTKRLEQKVTDEFAQRKRDR